MAVFLCIALMAYVLYQTEGFSKPYKLPRFSNGTINKPIALPDEALRNITGKGFPRNGVLTIELYNGSEWTITAVDVEVSIMLTNAQPTGRRFRMTIPTADPLHNKPEGAPPNSIVKPYSTAEMTATVGDFLDKVDDKSSWSWQLLEAFGYKQ